MANSNIVASADANVDQQPNPPPKQENTADSSWQPSKDSPLYPKLGLLMCHLSRDPLKAKEISAQASSLIIQSLSFWQPGLLERA